MSIKRNAYSKLIAWKMDEFRKPLLLRGARQVGKTTLVRAFSKEFDTSRVVCSFIISETSLVK